MSTHSSVEAGLPLRVGQRLKPQQQYICRLNNCHDNGGYVYFGRDSTQHVRACLRFGNQSEMAFCQVSSTLPGHAQYEAQHQRTAGKLVGSTVGGPDIQLAERPEYVQPFCH